MQDPPEHEIVELLELASDVKTRLRVAETRRTFGDAAEDRLDPGALKRVRNHLELALEALGAPVWGLTAPSAGALTITGFYSSEIYKALREVREGKGRPPGGRERRKGRRGRRAEDASVKTKAEDSENKAAETADPADSDAVAASPVQEAHRSPEVAPSFGANPLFSDPAQGVASTAPGADVEGDGEGSTWVRSRVDEIQRALSAAFGEDEILPDVENKPKPFSAPEFVGNTDALSIPELIGFFQLQGKTGVLTVDAPSEQFSLEYLRGELIHARSSSSPDGERLGEILVRLGAVSAEQLNALLSGKSAAERLGDALRRGELVTDEALAQALEVQIQNIFHRLFDLKGCRFTFREGLEGEPRARVRYNVTRLLLETARHRDEQRQAS